MRRHRFFGLGFMLIVVALSFAVLSPGSRAHADNPHPPSPQLTNGVFSASPINTPTTNVVTGPLVITDITGFGSILGYVADSASACNIGSSPIEYLLGGGQPPGQLLFVRWNSAPVMGARYFVPQGKVGCVYAIGDVYPLGLAWAGFIPD